jgi:uncharacterized Fe-S cluster-containing radical SAM superfamily protein
MYYMGINKNLVHQVGDQTKVILRCTVKQPSSFKKVLDFFRLPKFSGSVNCMEIQKLC